MAKGCIVCSAVASLDLQLQYCAACHSALHCSKDCQRKDWKQQHKKICNLLNVRDGAMQVRTEAHTRDDTSHTYERAELDLTEDSSTFFKLFTESTREGSRAAALAMREIAGRQTTDNQHFLLFHSLYLLVVKSDSKMLSWPNSPLLVLLPFVDPNVLFTEGGRRMTSLHHLADLADAFDYSTHERLLILAKQLIERGANVNAVTNYGHTPLHRACCTGNVTNLDFIDFLLKAGADPNAEDSFLSTPLESTMSFAPVDAVKSFSDQVALPDHPDQIRDEFLLKQWLEIEEMLVERGSHNTGGPKLE